MQLEKCLPLSDKKNQNLNISTEKVICVRIVFLIAIFDRTNSLILFHS